jgi:hypothetical protein
MRKAPRWMAVGVGSVIALRWIRVRRRRRLSGVTATSDQAHPGADGDPSEASAPGVSDAEAQVTRALELRLRMAEQAEQVACTEDQVAETFERLAGRGGPRESERRATAQQARDHAALERRRAAEYRTTTGTEADTAADDASSAAEG